MNIEDIDFNKLTIEERQCLVDYFNEATLEMLRASFEIEMLKANQKSFLEPFKVSYN